MKTKNFNYAKTVKKLSTPMVTKRIITMKVAMKMEHDLFEKGKKFNQWRIIFIAAVRKFRMSGAWAITPQHHATFGAWCGWASRKTGIAKATLQSYGTPNYIENHFRSDVKRKSNGYVMVTTFFGNFFPLWCSR